MADKKTPPGVMEAKRPVGRPPGKPTVKHQHTLTVRRAAQKLFLQHAEEARDVLLEIMRDVTAEPPVRLKAANDILDRALGKPTQQHNVSSENEGQTVNLTVLQGMPEHEVRMLLDAVTRLNQSNGEGPDVIDVTPEKN